MKNEEQGKPPPLIPLPQGEGRGIRSKLAHKIIINKL